MGTLQAVSATDNRGLEAAATLKNGLAVTIRELRPDDRDAIVRAVAGLDEQTIYTRLFGYHPVAAADIDRIMHVDPKAPGSLDAPPYSSGTAVERLHH
jgi:hypothetical protein